MESLTVGPNCQHLLPPLDSAEEREEDEIGRSRPLKAWFFLPIERERRGGEDGPTNGADGGL